MTICVLSVDLDLFVTNDLILSNSISFVKSMSPCISGVVNVAIRDNGLEPFACCYRVFATRTNVYVVQFSFG